MEDNTSTSVCILKLSDGTQILMEIDEKEFDGPVSIQEIEVSAKKAFKAIAGLTQDLKSTLAQAKPDSAKVEFMIELEKKKGDIFSKIVNFSGKGGIKFTLEWDFKKQTNEPDAAE